MQYSMAIRYSYGFLVLSLIACGNSKTHEKATGQTLYQQHCAACHGSKGNLGIGGAFDLTISTKSIEEIRYQVTNGSPDKRMIPFKDQLTKEEIYMVSDYLLTLRKKN